MKNKMPSVKFQPRKHTGRIFQKCKEKMNSEPKVFIDVDGVDEVQESFEQKAFGSGQKHKTEAAKNFITIDDNDSDDGVGHNQDSFLSSRMKFGPSLSRWNSPKKRECSGSKFMKQRFPLKVSNGKRTYSQKRTPRKYFSSNPLSESNSSKSDSSDCELMDGSVGNIRVEWEKAALKKKVSMDVPNSGLNNQVSSSGSNGVSEKIIELDDMDEFQEASVCSSSFKTNDDIKKSSAFRALSPDFTYETFFTYSPTEGTNTTFDSDIPSHSERHFSDKVYVSCETAGPQITTKLYSGGPSSHCDGYYGDVGVAQAEGGIHVKENQGCRNSYPTAEYGEDIPTFSDDFLNLFEEHTFQNLHFPKDNEFNRVSLEENRTLNSGEQVSKQPCVETNNTEYMSEQIFNSVPSQTTRLADEPEVEQGGCSLQNQKQHLEGLSCNSQLKKSQPDHERVSDNHEVDPNLNMIHTLSQGMQEELIHSQDDVAGDLTPFQSSIIDEKDKLKETAEYKRAIEEEWASRKQQLLIQAEEAQEAKRLMKRKRLETLRIQDMERRQKQRVEEMRETRRKDEETLNVKEQLRAGVRNELAKIELKVKDMPSLLRNLGVYVAGGRSSTLQQVHAAYKQALLRFHPDRASKSIIREQVEAEEKFKLISRLKEKLMPVL